MKAFEGELLSRTQRQENLAAINAFCRCLQTWRAGTVISACTDSWVLRKRATSEERWGGEWL